MSYIIVICILGLLGIGFYCLLITRNLLKLVVALQVLVKGAMLAILFAGCLVDNMEVAQSMALTIIVADTIVAVIGLAMAIQVRQITNTSNIRSISTLRK
jgi:multisubunit Na+/H+ antiporter MnhC subunit